ncbi:hypothetical protein V8E53_006834 [Lactarius tabidus]
MASFSTTLLAPTPLSTPLLTPTSAQDPDIKAGDISSPNAIVDAAFLDLFEASLLTPPTAQDLFKSSSPTLAPTPTQDPASDTKTGVEPEPLAHVSSANAMADTTVLDLDEASSATEAFEQRAPGITPSIADATVRDLLEAFGHGTDLISDPFTPINVHKRPSQAIQDRAEVVCKRLHLAPLSVKKVYEFIALSFEEQHVVLYGELLRIGDAIDS